MEKSGLFVKGLIAGALVSSAVSLMTTPRNMRMMKRKTGKLVKTLEDAVDNIT
ncbi:MAG: hypothetical protein RR073_02230 [Clostridia bacterium]